MNKILKKINQKTVIKKAIYFLYSLGMPYYETVQREEFLMQDGYKEIIDPALDEIRNSMSEYPISRDEFTLFLWNEEPYLAYLSDETPIVFEIILLSMLQRSYNLNLLEIFTVPLESLPEFADSKYGIVLLDNTSSINHQGVFFRNKFYYYSPLYEVRRNALNAPPLVNLLLDLKNNNNEVSLRLDETIGVSKEFYKPFMRSFSEVFQGREITLNDIQFPFHPGNSEYFCVYNPETMKKVQFRLSHRKDTERWIEAEELWDYQEDTGQQGFKTKYLHSIYNPLTNTFKHIDGSFNFYDNKTYKDRVEHQINAHATYHVKQWLVEGEISVIDWAKLILYFFDDNDLILDAFKGELTEDLF